MSDAELTREDLFVGLSSILTGLPPGELKPFADKDMLSQIFCDKVISEVGEDKLDHLLERFANRFHELVLAIEGQDSDPGLAALRQEFKKLEARRSRSLHFSEQVTLVLQEAKRQGDAAWWMGAFAGILSPGVNAPREEQEQAGIAASIIKMWYLGSWYAPEPKNDGERYFGGKVVPTPAAPGMAYVKGWVWRVAQTHPMGVAGHFGALGGEHGDWGDQPRASLDDMVEGK